MTYRTYSAKPDAAGKSREDARVGRDFKTTVAAMTFAFSHETSNSRAAFPPQMASI
jgi:hypothetical protein